LNVSCKIFSKALQLRLQPIFANVGNPNQITNIPLRLIVDNVLLTYKTIDLEKKSKQDMVHLNLYFSTMFDKVRWNFHFDALKQLEIDQ